MSAANSAIFAALYLAAAAVQGGGAPSAGGACQLRETGNTLVLANDSLSLAFDKNTGTLMSLRNLATGGEYPKDAGGDGNLFRAYVDTTEIPKVLQLSFPRPVQPVEGAMGGKLLDASSCRLVEHDYRRGSHCTEFRLTSRHSGFRRWRGRRCNSSSSCTGPRFMLSSFNRRRTQARRQVLRPCQTASERKDHPMMHKSISMNPFTAAGDAAGSLLGTI